MRATSPHKPLLGVAKLDELKQEEQEREMEEGAKKKMGINSVLGLGAGLFFQASTGNMAKKELWQTLDSQIKNVTGNQSQSNSNNVPYNVLSNTERLRAMGADLFNVGLNDLVAELTKPPILNSEVESMNEILRGNAHYENERRNSKNRMNTGSRENNKSFLII